MLHGSVIGESSPLQSPFGVTPLRAAIVHPDPGAADRLRQRLERDGAFDLVGAGCTGDDLAALLRSVVPDVVIVAHRPPFLDAIGVLLSVPAPVRPGAVVIATQKDDAVRAFDVGAADYVIEPYLDERLDRALERLGRMAHTSSASHGAGPVQRLHAPDRRLAVRLPGQVVLVPVAQISWIESAGNYVRVHSGTDVHMMRDTLAAIEARLGGIFLKIRRSALVNPERIRHVAYEREGDLAVVLRDGTRIQVGRMHEAAVRTWIEGCL